MKIDYSIIQAGGKGTRLKYLTRNRPKAIVPVNNRPIIFHLFEKFPNAKFIIIGDYKYDILQAYLEVFANVSYLIVQAKGQGNGCGIREALSFIPDKEAFMLIWSDLLLDDKVDFDELKKDCYIGITNKFECSWKYENKKLDKVSTIQNGVAGLFLFDEKDKLTDLPKTGSFTKWLSEENIEMNRLDLCNSQEVGSLQAIREVDFSNQNRCRPYNKMTFTGNKVIKEGLTVEGKELIRREEMWYKKVSECNFAGIPHIYSFEPLTMEKINGDNIFKGNFNREEKKQIIDKLVNSLNVLHKMEQTSPNLFDMFEDYYAKTMKRIKSIRSAIPFANQKTIIINGKRCKNIYFYGQEFREMVNMLLKETTEFGVIHGDGTLTNTMIDKDGNIYFIDARGYFGKTPLTGDVYYDWAKLYYSIEGAFDQFNIKKFTLNILEKEISFQIEKSGWEEVTEYFLDKIPDCNIWKIKMIHAIIWLSLASHCWEDFDSMCLAFYNGIYLWNELMQESR